MKIALFAKHLGQSWQAVALYREAVARGHQVDVFVDCQKLSAIYPFEWEQIPWRVDPIRFEEEEKYDLAIPFSRNLDDSWLNPTGFTLGLYPGGTGSYRNLAPSTLSPLSHNIWISQHSFEAKERIKQGFTLPHPVIGMPSISLYKEKKKETKSTFLKGLYLNGPPFAEKKKKAFDALLYRIGENEKGVQIHLKERFDKEDEGLHFLWHPFEQEKSSGIVLHPAQMSAVTLIQECDFLLGVCSTAFLEALYLDKPVLVCTDFGQERYVGELTQEIYWYAASGYTFCTEKELENGIISLYKGAKRLSDRVKKEIFPFNDPSFHIMNIAEEIYEAFRQVCKKGLFIPVFYSDKEQYREDIFLFRKRVIRERKKLEKQLDWERKRLSVRQEIFMRMAAVFPYIDDVKIEEFCRSYESFLESHPLEKVCENIPFVLYRWLTNLPDWEQTLAREGDLIEGAARFFFVEALFIMETEKLAAFTPFVKNTKKVIPKALEVYKKEYA
jgi:hypothetical protein